MTREYYHIQKWKKDEQKRYVSRGREDDLVFSDDDEFTIHDGVPTVDVYELEDNPYNGE